MLHSSSKDDALSTGVYAVKSSCSPEMQLCNSHHPTLKRFSFRPKTPRLTLWHNVSIHCTVTSRPITLWCCASGLTAATQRCLGGSDCGRHRSGSPWLASWCFYRWHTGSPPGPSWFCGGCSIGRLCRSRSNVVRRPGCWCSFCRRGARPCRSAPPSGTCCLSAGEESMKQFLFNDEKSYTLN